MNGTELLAKYKVTIGIILFVFVFVLVIYFIGKKAGKTKSTSVDLPTDLKDNATLSNAESTEVEALAGLLYSNMDGLAFFRDMDLWNRYLISTDRIFIATYNYFNSKYGNGESLYKWIADESSFTYGNNWVKVKETILDRMEKLKLY